MGDNEESVDAEDDSDIFASVMRWFYHSLMQFEDVMGSLARQLEFNVGKHSFRSVKNPNSVEKKDGNMSGSQK